VKLWESFGRLAFDISEPVDLGPRLVVRWHASGRGKRSGVAVDMEGWCVFTMRLGKVCRVEFYPSQDDALAAAAHRRA